MKTKKSRLLLITRKIEDDKRLAPGEIAYFLGFERRERKRKLSQILKSSALPLSLALGFFFSVFPEAFRDLVNRLPGWTNFSPHILSGVDYMWDLLGDPVRKTNILYHVPNIILYSFGIFGIKKLFDALEKRSWLDRVYAAQSMLKKQLQKGTVQFTLSKGHSLLFVGKGDFIAMQFALNHNDNEAITISESKPAYSSVWSHYAVDTMYEDLKKVIERSSGENAGEYIFFPVKDDQIFLPSAKAYDLSPHKLDILCQDIRTIEKENKWKHKRIILVGDRFQKSYVQSEDKKSIIKNSTDIVSLESIARRYNNVTILDPSDIVLKRIITIADGRKIVFRATKEGLAEYKKRFYTRLEMLGYKIKKGKKGILTIGYDLFEDQTEQQMLSHAVNDYYPVVLSKTVHDALLRNGYKKSEFIYVPDLVLQVTSHTAAQQ